MNLFFGFVHPNDAANQIESATRSVAVGYGDDVTVVRDATFHASGLITDGGAVLGQAQDRGVSIKFIGTVTGGIPEWSGPGSPMDDPDGTAHFLLKRYNRLGSRFLDGIPGAYVVALTDITKRTVLLGVDPANGHSLFVLQTRDGLAYGSKIGLMPMIVQDLELDRSLEDFLLGYQFLPGGRTIYKGVRSLQKGTLLLWQDGQFREHPIAQWHGKDLPDLSEASTEDATPVIYEAFMQALSDVAPSSEHVAVALGGFDSALVASGLRRLGKSVDTFTFEFSKQRYNQSHTDTLSQFAGTRHHWISIEPEVIAKGLETYGKCFNQIAVQPHYPIESVYLCQRVRQFGLTHAITGDGCDGIFLGYPTIYKRSQLISALSRIPRPLRSIASVFMSSRVLEKRLGQPYRLARNVLQILDRDPVVRDHFANRALDGFSLNQIREHPPEQDREVEEVLRDLALDVAGLSTLRRAYHSKGLAGGNKNKVESCIDNTGVAVTSPFVHPRFAKIASSIPDHLSRPEGTLRKTEGAQGKFVLMNMAEKHDLLPNDIIHQRKRSPAEAPVDTWYAGSLRDRVLPMLERLPFAIPQDIAAALISPKFSESLYRRYVSIDDIATQAFASLVTYGAFTEAVEKSES